jgi:predicted secreted protein
MAVISGKQGLVKFGATPGQVAKLTSFTIESSFDMIDVTVMATAAVLWRNFISGLGQWSASVDGKFDVASTGQAAMRTSFLAGTTSSIRGFLDKTGLESVGGGCFVENVAFGVTIDGEATFSAGLRGNGALTYTTV